MNDWIQWFGGLTPNISENTIVEVRFRDRRLPNGKDTVSHWRYGHGQNNWSNDDDPEDIVAYRVVCPNGNKEIELTENWIEWDIRASGASSGPDLPPDTRIDVMFVNGRVLTNMKLGVWGDSWYNIWTDMEPHNTVSAYKVSSSGPVVGRWIEWDGSQYEHTPLFSPVPKGSVVDVKFRDGEIYERVKAGVILNPMRDRDAAGPFWNNENHSADIVAYRVVLS